MIEFWNWSPIYQFNIIYLLIQIHDFNYCNSSCLYCLSYFGASDISYSTNFKRALEALNIKYMFSTYSLPITMQKINISYAFVILGFHSLVYSKVFDEYHDIYISPSIFHITVNTNKMQKFHCKYISHRCLCANLHLPREKYDTNSLWGDQSVLHFHTLCITWV